MKNFFNQRGMSTPIAVLLVVVILIAAGFLYFNYRDNGYQSPEGDVNEEDVMEKDGEDSGANMMDNGDEGKAMDKKDTMKKDEIITLLLNDSATQATLLTEVDGSESSGTAYRLVRDGKLYHGVIATMPEPGSGNSYEGWLVQPSPLKFFSTGLMRSPEKGVWVLEYSASQEYPTYLRVVITEETIVDATPEKHIIEGDF